MFHVGINAGLHELLRTNYCAPTTAETPISARDIILSELTINLGVLNILFNLYYKK